MQVRQIEKTICIFYVYAAESCVCLSEQKRRLMRPQGKIFVHVPYCKREACEAALGILGPPRPWRRVAAGKTIICDGPIPHCYMFVGRHSCVTVPVGDDVFAFIKMGV